MVSTTDADEKVTVTLAVCLATTEKAYVSRNDLIVSNDHSLKKKNTEKSVDG